ncbi:hypothetical protein CK203_025669 [Vitis vinifera]|uniref:HAT C-terminal dimerisation domain-containing protein n=1 Tax=Vitis vinifera TaxID=29760 RepID=A0A438IE97_VITVI|nr:hypothetical protein CK203_025669 [Vitis vinifera]
MKPCNKVSEDARLEWKEALANFKDKKTKRNELLQEIGMGPTSMHESALSKTIGTLGSGSGSGEPIPRGPMDKFTTSQPRQNAVANFGPGFKPLSMHELRTWILKEEVNDLSIIMEDHKKAWKQYGCSIMSDGWTDGKKIGEENVVQVITDNASNYVNVGMRLMEKRSRLRWTPCATHCIDLMLEDIGKLNVHATTLSRARQVVKFIYGHTWVLSLMRTFTKNHELIHPAITRFATAFLTLQSLYKQKQTLIAMFSSEKWCSSTWAKKVEGVKTRSYYLNPQLWYGDKFSNVDEVRKGLFECMDRMLDYQERLKADIQLDSYDQAMGEFGSRITIDSRTLRSPTSWWMRFGGSTPELQKFAIRVLSLTCSASGCERNWSTFESIYTKKRNRLEHQRLNALVYVRYNTRLRERSLQRKQNVDPILVEEIDSDDEWIAEKEDPLLPLDLCWLQDNELFNVDAIRVVSSNSQETQASSDHMVSSHSYKRKHNEVPSTSGGKGKEKELNLTPIDEDEDLDEMGIHDSGHFPTIDTLDEDDDDFGEEDLS